MVSGLCIGRCSIDRHYSSVGGIRRYARHGRNSCHSRRADYAILATIAAGCILILALYVKLRSGLPAAGFPVIPMFALVPLIGVFGVTL